MIEWREYRGICMGCKKPVRYGEENHRDKYGTFCQVDTNWQSRVNPSNERWRPGYRFKIEKYSGYRKYNCFYGIDRNGKIEFQGGVKAPPAKLVELHDLYQDQRPKDGNWYPGCELDEL